MWEWVEIWKDGKEVKFGSFESVQRATEECSSAQMPWADDVVDHIIIRRVKE